MNLSINMPSRFSSQAEGSSRFLLPMSISDSDSDDENETYDKTDLEKMFKGRIKAEHIFNTYENLSKFRFNYIGDDYDKIRGNDSNAGASMVKKIKEIKSKINMFETRSAKSLNNEKILSDGTVISKKDIKTLYENDDFIIKSPSYSYIDAQDTFYKIYAIKLQGFEIEKQTENMDKQLLLFLAVVNELMKEEFIYHQKTYGLVQNYNTIEKMTGYIKDNSNEGCGKIRFESSGLLKESCNQLVKSIAESENKMDNYTVVIPEIYETNMNEDGFYYDESHIYYYMRMSKVPNTRTTRIQTIEECQDIKPLISVIDGFLIMNGISHNDYSTKGNVFVDVNGKNIYIIDFGTSGDYVYNAGATVNLSNHINSLNITCDKRKSNQKSSKRKSDQKISKRKSNENSSKKYKGVNTPTIYSRSRKTRPTTMRSNRSITKIGNKLKLGRIKRYTRRFKSV